MMLQTRMLLVAALILLAACGPAEEEGDEDSLSPAEQVETPMQSMSGMPGMQSESTILRMQAQMDAMMRAGADSMAGMMPAHRQMAANMLAEMNREMQQMNMGTDEAWTVTVDSVRQDLTRMPELTPDEMAAFMSAHQNRLTRLMEMHRSMMSSMRR